MDALYYYDPHSQPLRCIHGDTEGRSCAGECGTNERGYKQDWGGNAMLVTGIGVGDVERGVLFGCWFAAYIHAHGHQRDILKISANMIFFSSF